MKHNFNIKQALKETMQAANESVMRSSGGGSFYSQYASMMTSHDKFGVKPIPAATELSPLLFITRPNLNLFTTSLRQNRTTMMLDTLDTRSLAFAIRCYLCRDFAKYHRSLAKNANFFEYRTPFLIPLTNNITSFSGVPDFTVDYETTEGGFFGEDLTYPIGSDEMSGTYDISIGFRDVQGSIIFAMLFYWLVSIAKLTIGDTVAFPDYIDENRLCHTSAIYGFILDPSKRYISKWFRMTGCSPKAMPLGQFFNVNENEAHASSISSFSVPFVANKVEVMDPIILSEFNMCTHMFWPKIHDFRTRDDLVALSNEPEHNYRGIPYIDTLSGSNELLFIEERRNTFSQLDETQRRVRELIYSGGR